MSIVGKMWRAKNLLIHKVNSSDAFSTDSAPSACQTLTHIWEKGTKRGGGGGDHPAYARILCPEILITHGGFCQIVMGHTLHRK